MILASAIHEGYGDTMRTTISTLVSYPHWLTLERKGAFPVWWGVLQWRSCYVLQRSSDLQHR